MDQLKKQCFRSIEKTLQSREDYIIAEEHDKAHFLLQKAEARILFARELGLLDDTEYIYLQGKILNRSN